MFLSANFLMLFFSFASACFPFEEGNCFIADPNGVNGFASITRHVVLGCQFLLGLYFFWQLQAVCVRLFFKKFDKIVHEADVQCLKVIMSVKTASSSYSIVCVFNHCSLWLMHPSSNLLNLMFLSCRHHKSIVQKNSCMCTWALYEKFCRCGWMQAHVCTSDNSRKKEWNKIVKNKKMPWALLSWKNKWRHCHKLFTHWIRP